MIKVLAIDDDSAMTELLTLMLKAHGFDVFTANTGEDGVRLIREKTPELISPRGSFQLWRMQARHSRLQ